MCTRITKGDEVVQHEFLRISVIVGVVVQPDDFNQVDEDEGERVPVYTPRSCKMRSVRLYLI